MAVTENPVVETSRDSIEWDAVSQGFILRQGFPNYLTRTFLPSKHR